MSFNPFSADSWNRIGNDIKKTADTVSGDINNTGQQIVNDTVNGVGQTIQTGWETEIVNPINNTIKEADTEIKKFGISVEKAFNQAGIEIKKTFEETIPTFFNQSQDNFFYYTKMIGIVLLVLFILFMIYKIKNIFN